MIFCKLLFSIAKYDFLKIQFNASNLNCFQNGEWSCECQEGWEGDDCSVRLERYCDDGKDDDQGKQFFTRFFCKDS